MRRLLLAAFALLLVARPVAAHPTPFSYLDIRVGPTVAEVRLVAHIIDIAHDLGIDPPERLFDASVLEERRVAGFAARPVRRWARTQRGTVVGSRTDGRAAVAPHHDAIRTG
jgi:hypothetical protein